MNRRKRLCPQLILKRASAGRPSGEWSDDDYDVLADGVVVGRIFKAAASPVGSPWMCCRLSRRSNGLVSRATMRLPPNSTSATCEPRAAGNGPMFRSARCFALSRQARPPPSEALKAAQIQVDSVR
jgi:hypothetical protein